MEEDLIKNITKLRYFKSDLDNKLYGDFYITTKEGSYFVFLNNSELCFFRHLLGESPIECICYPSEEVKDEFWKKIKEWF